MAHGCMNMHDHGLGVDKFDLRPLIGERHGNVLNANLAIQFGVTFQRELELLH